MLLGLNYSKSYNLFSFFERFYLCIYERHTHTEAETQAEGEAGSMQGARCGDSIPGLQDHALGQRQGLKC